MRRWLFLLPTLLALLLVVAGCASDGGDQTTTTNAAPTTTAPASTTTTTTIPIIGVRDVEPVELADQLCDAFEEEPRAIFGDLDEDGVEDLVVSVLCTEEEIRVNGVFTEGTGSPMLVAEVSGNDATIIGSVRPNLALVMPVRLEGDPEDEPSLVERVTYALEDGGLHLVDQRQLTPDFYQRAYAPNQPPRLTRIELLEELRTGVGLIQTVACYPFSGSGTGFLVAPDLLVTNAHVVGDAILLRVEVGGEVFSAELIGRDEVRDLALLQLPSDADGHIFDFTNDQPRVGTAVTALGFPLDPRFSATGGEISGVGRRIIIGESFYENAIQTSAAINPGNSGGPLVDEDGQVIGVVSARYAADNVGFVIPVDTVSGAIEPWSESRNSLSLAGADGCDTGTSVIDTNVVDIDLPSVLYSLDEYVGGINYGEPRRAWEVNASSVEGDFGYEEFREGVSTSSLYPFRIESINRTSGDEITVEVRFTSYQSPEFGRDGQTCTEWHQRYDMRGYDDGVWRIENSSPIEAPLACLEEEAAIG